MNSDFETKGTDVPIYKVLLLPVWLVGSMVNVLVATLVIEMDLHQPVLSNVTVWIVLLLNVLVTANCFLHLLYRYKGWTMLQVEFARFGNYSWAGYAEDCALHGLQIWGVVGTSAALYWLMSLWIAPTVSAYLLTLLAHSVGMYLALCVLAVVFTLIRERVEKLDPSAFFSEVRLREKRAKVKEDADRQTSKNRQTK
jgi:hypothetical protein